MAKKIMTFRNGKAFVQDPESFLIESMQKTGVSNFWTFSTLSRLRQVMSGNKHFVFRIDEAKVIADDEVIVSIEAKGMASLPDDKMESLCVIKTILHTSGRSRWETKISFK